MNIQQTVQALKPYLQSAAACPRTCKLFFDQFETSPARVLTLTVNTSQPYNAWWNVASAADGDMFIGYALLDAGTYTATVLGLKSTGFGMSDLYIDDVKVNSAVMDWYASSTAYNKKWVVTGIVIATAGLHKVTYKVNGKNASSAGYVIAGTCITMLKTD